MRLLITGASGFLGRNMLLALPPDWQVVALHRPGNAAFLSFLQERHLPHVQPLACDLTDRQQVEQAIRRVGNAFDTCLALASNTSIPDSIERPIHDLTTNVFGLLNVLECCELHHLVYLSSGAVYVGHTGLVTPDTAVSPDLPYAISKLAAEQYINAYAIRRGSPQRATIIRFFGAYVPYEPSRKLYTRLVQRFAQERNPHFNVVGDGENYIDAMYISDTVRALLAVLRSLPAGQVRVIDLGVGSCETVNQVVTRAARLFGLEPRISYAGTAPEYIRFFVDPQPFAQAYGFVPTVPLEDGLRVLAAHLERRSVVNSM